MKKLIIAAVLMLGLTGCVDSTAYGPCIGAFDDEDPTLTYKLSVRNVFWGIVGIELVYPPIKVLADQMLCPVGRKEVKN